LKCIVKMLIKSLSQKENPDDIVIITIKFLKLMTVFCCWLDD